MIEVVATGTGTGAGTGTGTGTGTLIAVGAGVPVADLRASSVAEAGRIGLAHFVARARHLDQVL